MTQSDSSSTNPADCLDRQPYHTPLLHEYGEIVQLTKGVAGTGADGASFASVDLGA